MLTTLVLCVVACNDVLGELFPGLGRNISSGTISVLFPKKYTVEIIWTFFLNAIIPRKKYLYGIQNHTFEVNSHKNNETSQNLSYKFHLKWA